MKKNLILFLHLLFIVFFSISANNSIWPNSNFIKNEDKLVCVEFQFLKGSNRLAEFNKIEKNILQLDWVNLNQSNQINKLSIEEIEKILGMPDAKLNNSIKYILNPSTNTIAVFTQTNSGSIELLVVENK